MNISRRTFLQVMAALPIVAALPKTDEVLAALPLVEDTAPLPPIAHNWLKINGTLVALRSLSLDSRQDFIDSYSWPDYNVLHRYPGLRTNVLEMELEDHSVSITVASAFYERQPILIEAGLGPATLKANGHIYAITGYAPIDSLPTVKIQAALTHVEWI